MDKVIQRHGQLSTLLKKTDDLNEGSLKLSKAARVLHRKVWKDKIKMYCGVCLLATVSDTQTVVGIFVVWVLT
jgi:hypothetical protein